MLNDVDNVPAFVNTIVAILSIAFQVKTSERSRTYFYTTEVKIDLYIGNNN